MRRGFGFLWVAVTGIFVALVGVIAYQAGWAAGAATVVPAGTAAEVPYYYGGPQFFGFGFFWFLFILFLLFVLFRVARFGRGWGYRGYGGYKGYGGGQSGGHSGVPPAIDERMREWHQRAHGEPAPAPPSDTKTV